LIQSLIANPAGRVEIDRFIAGAISMLAQLGMFFGRRRDNNSGLGIVGSLLMLVLTPLAGPSETVSARRKRA
jgi:heat shock protein HtpX